MEPAPAWCWKGRANTTTIVRTLPQPHISIDTDVCQTSPKTTMSSRPKPRLAVPPWVLNRAPHTPPPPLLPSDPVCCHLTSQAARKRWMAIVFAEELC